MPFSDITSLAAADTFETMFNKNNEIIARINVLDIGGISGGTGINVSSISTTGGITLSIDYSTINSSTCILNNTNIEIVGSIPSGFTLGSVIGFTGGTFGSVHNTSMESAEKMVGFISQKLASSWKIATSGTIGLTGSLYGLSDSTLYYLNAGGTLTSTIPTTAGTVVKPVLYVLGSTYGALIVNQRGSLIETVSTSIKSSARNIAEIYGGGVSAGNAVYYDVTGATWSKSIANDFAKAEVFGIVESITGVTATVVTHGSISLPAGITHLINDGGSGGNDIWFLSGTTAGALQNSGPTFSNNIVKPLYYNAPHSLNGITFTGTVVNYLGYRIT